MALRNNLNIRVR